MSGGGATELVPVAEPSLALGVVGVHGEVPAV